MEQFTRRLLFLDGWRGLAIICVLIGHFFPISGIKLGIFGVELFFVLSGRLMADILFIQRFPLGEFYKRRFSRIYPAFFVFVLAIGLLKLSTNPEFNPKAILMALSLIYNYDIWIPQEARTSSLDHIWSLCVEEHSYIILGLIAYCYRRVRFSVTWFCATIAIAAMINGAANIWVYNNDFFRTYWRTDVHISSIFISSAIYLATRDLKVKWTPLISFLMGVVFSLNYFPWPIHYTLGTSCLAYSVATIDLIHPKIEKWLSSPLLRYIGMTSYSIYLWQQPFYKASVNHGFRGTILFFIGAIICGLSSYYCIEQPARRWINSKR